MATLDDLSLDQLQALYDQKTDPQVAAIHSIESGGAAATANPVNPASGARSSMQVMDKTAKNPGYNVKPSDGTPVDDTRTGVQYYQHLRDEVYHDPVKAAVAYNWGPGNADKWIANGAKLDDLPLQTLQYVQKFQKKTAGAQAPQQAQQPAEKPLPQPTTTEMKIVEQPAADTPDYTFGGRLAQGAMDTMGGAARAGLHGLGWLLDKAGDKQGAASLNDTVQQAEEAQAARTREFELKRQQAGGGTGTDWVQVGGKMIPAFLVPGGGARSLLGAMGEGAAGGAVLGAADTPPGESYGQHAATGGLTGGAVGGALNAVGKIIGGARLSPEVQQLVDEGVTPTPGQTIGPKAKAFEDRLTSTPIVGEYIKEGQRAAISDMNTALYNRVLDPIGEAGAIRPGTPVREAVEQIGDRITNRYNALLPNLSFRPDATYNADMTNILIQHQAQLPAAMRRDFDSIMNDNILNYVNQTGSLAGQNLKNAESALTTEIGRYMKYNTRNDDRMVEALRGVRDALRGGIERQNPQYAGQLQSINRAYAEQTILQNAASKVTNPHNPIMPSQLQQAVKAGDNTVRKNAFAKGNARMQDLSDASMAVLGNNVPDSGTAGRMMLNAGLLGGTGLAGAMANPALGAALLGVGGAYSSDIGRKAMFALLARRPELIRSLGRGIEGLAPTAGLLSGAVPPPGSQ